MIGSIIWILIGLVLAYIVYKNTGKNEHPILWALGTVILTFFVFLVWYLVGPGKNYRLFGGSIKGVG